MRLIIRNDPASAADFVADYILGRLREFDPTPTRPFVLGLPTGGSPIGVYEILAAKYKAGEVSCWNACRDTTEETLTIPPGQF